SGGRADSGIAPVTLDRVPQHQIPDFADRLVRIKRFRAILHTVHDRVTTVQLIGAFQGVQTLFGGLVTAVGEESPSLLQGLWSMELVRVPPERGTGGGATATHDALVQAIQLIPIFRRLQNLLLG